MFEDLLASAKNSITERLTSPLLGSFVVAWSLWNYKFLVILFSTAGVSQTFLLIDTVAFPTIGSVLTRGILYPLAGALLYVFAYPYPSLFVYEFTLKQQRKINSRRQEISEETLLSLPKSRALRKELADLEIRNQATIDRLTEENSRLKTIVEKQHTDVDPETSKDIVSKYTSTPLSESELNVLRYIAKCGGVANEDGLIYQSSASRVKTDFDLEELVSKNLIEKDFNQESHEYQYKFTQEGRRILLASEPQKG